MANKMEKCHGLAARVMAGTITGIITSRRGWMGLSGALEQPAHAPMHAICRLRKGQMNEQTGNRQVGVQQN